MKYLACYVGCAAWLFLSSCGGDDESPSTTGGGSSGSSGNGGTGTDGSGATGGNGATGGVPTDGSSGVGGSAGATGGTAGTAGQGGTAGGTDAGTGGTAGAGGSGGQPPLGDPITGLTPGMWQWVPIAGARCRNGSETGIGVNLSSTTTRVMIYLEGGGACFNSLTCLANPAAFGQSDFGAGKSGGIFDRANTANPVRDWTHVYIPYCTGDVHVGNNPNANVPGGPMNQQFVGRLNMEASLRRIVPTVNASLVLLTGVSAGGFGAAANYDLVSRYYGSVPVLLLDDSGPPMSSQYVPTCLQQQWRTIWGLDRTMLADCGSACPNQNDYLVDFSMFVINKYTSRAGGLVSALQDNTIRLFYGFGLNNCTVTGVPNMPAAQFQAGLEDYRSRIQGKNFGTYYVSSTSHTWIGGGTFYSTTVQNTPLTTWVAALINGTTSHVAP